MLWGTYRDAVECGTLAVTTSNEGSVSWGLEILAEVRRVVASESQCCKFLTFKVYEVSLGIRLEVTGPDAAIAMIEDLFGGVAE